MYGISLPLSRTAALPVAEIGVAARFRLRSAQVLRGMPYEPTRGDLFRQTGSALRIAGRGHWMLTGEVPLRAILLHCQSMGL
jgi:hypothetical protein